MGKTAQRSRYSNRAVTCNYSNTAVIHFQKLELLEKKKKNRWKKGSAIKVAKIYFPYVNECRKPNVAVILEYLVFVWLLYTFLESPMPVVNLVTLIEQLYSLAIKLLTKLYLHYNWQMAVSGGSALQLHQNILLITTFLDVEPSDEMNRWYKLSPQTLYTHLSCKYKQCIMLPSPLLISNLTILDVVWVMLIGTMCTMLYGHTYHTPQTSR